MNKPHVIRNVLSQEERISLWDYFDRRSPSMSTLATWTFNNASYGQGRSEEHTSELQSHS